jgi:septal ring factor EnvC (AmiA/AmiB activator)
MAKADITMWDWAKEQWKFLVGALAALLTGFLVLLRLKTTSDEHKENFQDAKDASEAELRTLKDSRAKLESGLEKIDEESDKKVREIEKTAEEKEADLEREKQDLIDEAKEADDLAKKIAKIIGADFVDSPKE